MASLKAAAEKAESCATSFLKFKDVLPSTSDKYITSVVTELFGLSKAIQKFWGAFSHRDNEPYTDLVVGDLNTVSKSIQHTLRDVERHFAPLEEIRDRGLYSKTRRQEAYRDTWRSIMEHFANEGAKIQGCETLTSRADTYRVFLDDLRARLDGDGTSRQFKDMQYRLEKLLLYQEKSLEDRVSKLSLNPPATPSFKKHPSWERHRPKGRIEAPPQAGRSSRLPPRMKDREVVSRKLQSDSDFEDLCDTEEEESDDLGSPVGYEMVDDHLDFIPPAAPAAPLGRRPSQKPGTPVTSPLYRNHRTGEYFVVRPEMPRGISSSDITPTTSAVSSETNSTINDRHWVSVVFGQPRSSTVFRTSGPESGCHGEHMAGITAGLREDYDEILKLPFEDGGLQLRILIREHDLSGRLLVRQERGRNKITSCQPITSLRILRCNNSLQLCLPGPKRDQALKAQDEAKPIARLTDASLQGETCHFTAVIIDDNFRHALQILREKDSKGVRLQASVYEGELKRTPVWTAFITHQMASKTWARRVDSRKIHLQDLSRYIFTDDYEPQLGPSGEHELRFMRAKDAKLFYDTIDDIAMGNFGK